VGLLDSLKGKNVKIKIRELSTINGKLVDYDDLYVFIQVTKTEKGKTTTETYYIPHFNIIYITPT
jgi:small nuclear ribonucleoprotein (snRNP)-like protein